MLVNLLNKYRIYKMQLWIYYNEPHVIEGQLNL